MKTTTLVCVFLLSISELFAQVQTPQNFDQKREHIEFEIDYYLVAQEDIEKLNDQDKVRLKEMRTERKVQRFIDENEQLSTLIEIREQDQAFSDWMQAPEIIYIDEAGITNYDARGNKLRYVEHSPKYLEMASRFDKNLSENFDLPKGDLLQKMLRSGLIRDLGNNLYEGNEGKDRFIFNPEQNYIEEIHYDENDEALYRTQRSYIELPNGEKFLEMSKESKSLLLSSGVKAEHIILKLYSDQNFESVYSHTKEVEKLKISSLNDQKIEVQHKAFEGKVTEAFIYNTNGMLLQHQQVNSMGISQVDIADLAPGIYILKISAEGQSLSVKFVKL